MKQQWILVIAIVAGIAAFWMTRHYLNKERDKIRMMYQMVEVVAAASDLPKGTVLKAEDMGSLLMHKGSVGDRYIPKDDWRQIIGQTLLFHVPRNNAIQWTDILPFYGDAGLAGGIQPGMRAISIAVDIVASVSSMVKPNDRVDVLGTFSFPSKSVAGEMETVTLIVLQDVTVLATGQQMARASTAAGDKRQQTVRSYSSVTFEVTPLEAELLVFAQTVKGRLLLALRNPSDVSYVKDLPVVNFEHLQKKLPELNLIRQRDIRHRKDL